MTPVSFSIFAAKLDSNNSLPYPENFRASSDAVDADATLYTDGITDVFDSRGEMLKVEGVQNFVRETALLPFNEMKEGILNRVAAWRHGPLPKDWI